MTTPDDVDAFRAAGYLVLRDAFDPVPLSEEMERAFADGLPTGGNVRRPPGVEFRFLPMMNARTPVSLSLLDALAAEAADLLGRPVLPGRAKGTRYAANTAAHRDSDVDLPSMAFVAYLEPLVATNGALRVVPGSHRDTRPSTSGFVAVETRPGDLIAFDEHLTHASDGGRDRRQWRVDYFADPRDADEVAIVHDTYARVFDAGWDPGYDVGRFPNYDEQWQRWDRPWTARLRELGLYDLAAAQARAVLMP